jgi:phospholipase C
MSDSNNAPETHPGWVRLNEKLRAHVLTRRQMIPAATAFGLWPALLGATTRQRGDRAHWNTTSKIRHVVILVQENRSFDHYFGSFAEKLAIGRQRGDGFVRTDLAYLDSAGTGYHPFHLTQFCDADPDHGWEGSHASGTTARWAVGSRLKPTRRPPSAAIIRPITSIT